METGGQSEKAERLMKLLEAMRELHENGRNYLNSLDIREKLQITPNTSDSRQFLRDLSDAVYLGIVFRQENKCPSCGHSLPQDGLFCLPELRPRLYVAPDFLGDMARSNDMSTPKAKCQQCGKLCDSTKLTKVGSKSKLLCPACQEKEKEPKEEPLRVT